MAIVACPEQGWWKGRFLLFEDKGPLSKGAKTRVYQVTSRGQLLGYVKWMNYWRKYAFFTNNVILEDDCLADIGQFIKDRTEEQRQDWKKQSIVDWDLVKATHVENQS